VGGRHDSAALTAEDLDTRADLGYAAPRDTSALPERTVVLAIEFTDRTVAIATSGCTVPDERQPVREEPGTRRRLACRADRRGHPVWLGHLSWQLYGSRRSSAR